MTIKTRIEKAEKGVNPNAPPVIHVWFSGNGYHERHGPGGEVLERLNDAEWAERMKNEKVIQVPSSIMDDRI